MKKNLTEIVFILDCSGSMNGLEGDTIGGAIHHIGNVHKYARPEDVPEHTLFVITTDGLENASRHYDIDRVKSMIERRKKKYGWEFMFLGANIDAVETAGWIGIDADRAVNYRCDGIGTALNFEVLSDAISDVRADEELTPQWKKRIDADFRARGGRKKIKGSGLVSGRSGRRRLPPAAFLAVRFAPRSPQTLAASSRGAKSSQKFRAAACLRPVFQLEPCNFFLKYY